MHSKIIHALLPSRKNPLAIVSTALLGAVSCSAPALSQEIQTKDTARISVHANGTASARPDMAVLNLSVSNEAETAKKAMDQTGNAMAQVMKAMKAAGIRENDMQTVGLTVWPIYQSDEPSSEDSRKKGYKATNTLSVKVHDLDRLGQIVDDAVTNGANGIGQMTLTNADPQPLYDEARKNAVASAMAKAKLFLITHIVQLASTACMALEVLSMPLPRSALSVLPSHNAG
jgi:uncharacterized protein YggE